MSHAVCAPTTLYEYFQIKSWETLGYIGLTYNSYRSFMMQLVHGNPDEIVAIGAHRERNPIGLALAQISDEDATARLLSVFTLAGHRRKGIADALMRRIEEEARERGCRMIMTAYEQERSNRAAVEGMLRTCGFPPSRVRSLICRSSVARIRQAPWLDEQLMPAAFEICPWTAVTETEQQAIREMPHPGPLSPFVEEHRIEPLNSLGLRYEGVIVGWLITHRIAEDTIRYTNMFVREDLQRIGVSIPLLIEAVKRHVDADDTADKLSFVVHSTSNEMIDLVQKHLAPFLDITHSVETTKTL